MCNYHDRFNPVRCIVPPYIGEKLADNSDKAVAKLAVKNLTESVKLRAKRSFVSGLSEEQTLLLNPPKVAKKKATPKLNMQVYNMRHGTDPSTSQLVWDNGKIKHRLDKAA